MKPFQLLIATLATILMMFGCKANAETFRPDTEKAILSAWVIDNAQVKLTQAQARKIVATAVVFAERRGLDPLLILSMQKAESGFRFNAVSSEGAKGIMQVLPRYHKDKLKGRNPFDPLVSTEVGTQILKDCWDRSNANLKMALNCYSGGARTYYAKIKSHHTEMARLIVEQQFLNEEPITPYLFGKMPPSAPFV